MRRFMKTRVALAALLPMLALTAVAVGQQTEREQPAGQKQTQLPTSDQKLAAVLVIDNKAEIAFSRFGLEHLQNEAAREFAEMMVKQHADYVRQLQMKAGLLDGIERQPATRGEAGAADRANPNRANENAAQPERAAGQRKPAARGQLDFVQFHEEYAERHLKTLQQELRKKQGRNFDAAFMHAQVMLHLDMIDKLQVAKRFASPELEPLITEGINHTQEHLEQARQLHQQLEGRVETAREPARPEQQ